MNANKRIFTDILVNGFSWDLYWTVVQLWIQFRSPSTRIFHARLRWAKFVIWMFNGLQLLAEGMISVLLTHPMTQKQLSVEAFFTKHKNPDISMATCKDLNLIHIIYENIYTGTDDSFHENICIKAVDSCELDRTLRETDNSEDFYNLFNGSLRLIIWSWRLQWTYSSGLIPHSDKCDSRCWSDSMNESGFIFKDCWD